MKKALVLLLIVAMLPALLFANGANEASAKKADGPIELVYWSHYGQSPAFVQAFADSINAAAKKLGYDNVTCRAEVIEYDNYEAKYLTGFAGDNGPDFFLARTSDWAMDGGKNPIAAEFSKEATAAWDKAIAPMFFDCGMFNGKRYGFACEGSGFQFLFINTDHMKEAGLDPEKDLPKTIDDLTALAHKLTKKDASGKIIRSGWQPRYLGGGGGVSGKFMSYFHQFGARALSPDLKTATGYINGPDAIRAFTWLQTMAKECANLEFGGPEGAFQSGQASIINREAWFFQDTVDKAPNIHFVCIPFPGGDKANVIASAGASPWANMVSAKSKHLDLCMELLTELAKPEYDVSLHEPAGYPPVLAATMTLDNAYFKSQPFAEAMMNSATKNGAPCYDSISQWGPIEAGIGDAVAAIVTGADVKATLDAVAERSNQLLKQN